MLRCAWIGLVAGVLTALPACGIEVRLPEQTPQFATLVTLNKTEFLLDQWRLAFGRYPSGAIEMPPKFAGSAKNNGICEGIEAVYQSFLWPGFKCDPDWRSHDLANVDGDQLSRPANRLGEKALLEIVDAWGNPLVYISASQYADVLESGVQCQTAAGEPRLARPYRDRNGAFKRAQRFQLYSMGPDATPNTDDDVLGWQ